jgi:undecaprenyl-diphosphatase
MVTTADAGRTAAPFEPTPSRWARWADRDLHWSLRLHRSSQHRVLQAVLVTISRLGDGGFWYALMAWLMYVGGPARHTAWMMLVAGVANLAVYSVLKRTTARSRPYVVCDDIKACVRALDRGSFPSGHTMHAVCFATLAGLQFPLLGLTLAPFVALTAYGRVALGLHYPSDVAAGAGIGLFSAAAVMLLM